MSSFSKLIEHSIFAGEMLKITKCFPLSRKKWKFLALFSKVWCLSSERFFSSESFFSQTLLLLIFTIISLHTGNYDIFYSGERLKIENSMLRRLLSKYPSYWINCLFIQYSQVFFSWYSVCQQYLDYLFLFIDFFLKT